MHKTAESPPAARTATDESYQAARTRLGLQRGTKGVIFKMIPEGGIRTEMGESPTRRRDHRRMDSATPDFPVTEHASALDLLHDTYQRVKATDPADAAGSVLAGREGLSLTWTSTGSAIRRCWTSTTLGSGPATTSSANRAARSSTSRCHGWKPRRRCRTPATATTPWPPSCRRN